MVFVNGIIKGKNDIPDQTFHHVYMIFAIVFIIGHILINKNQETVLCVSPPVFPYLLLIITADKVIL